MNSSNEQAQTPTAEITNVVKTIIETERLRLRTLSIQDAAFYLSLVNDPSFIKNIRDKGVRTIADAEDTIRTGHQEIQAKQGFSLYLLETKIERTPIGLCGLVKREQLPGIDLGYALLPAYWRQGYAEEACRAVIEYAKTHLRQAQLYAIVSPHNNASSKLLEKLGFQFRETIDWTDGPVLFYCLEFNA